MARKIAIDLLRSHNAREVFTKLAYAIGKPDPVMAVALIDGKEEIIAGYDLTPRGIRKALKLDTLRYADTSLWGHFGRAFPWDK
ncbi:hypothetical protein A3A09_02970 [Candidatus Nomurabacteria bacterium RIFCSPLOWO2_01_FULL_42_20]|nr:MAG: hypothetical protein A3A09_02970 [Candidatus Nomurabacteria bacterium RIFCSPLOWO2_01_FULL_42_20]